MREIIFRGKDEYTNEWVFGSFCYRNDIANAPVIQEIADKPTFRFYHNIKIETLGQFAGLIDKNGKEIYEGDIINLAGIHKGVVEFDYGVFGINWDYNRKDGHKTMLGSWGQLHNLRTMDDEIYPDLEVIGNIYDNKNLLEK